jgi:archaellum biogenesis ATPase FlaH
MSKTPEARALPIAEFLEQAQASIEKSDKAGLWGLHIQARAVTLLSGQTSAGKTTFLHVLAYHLAEGREFLGIKPPRPLRVLYMDYESPLDVLKEHFTRIGASANLYVIDPGTLPKTHTLLRDLKALVHRHKIDLVIVDPLMVAYHVEDENNNAQANEQMEPFREVVRETQAGIVLVHNTGRKVQDAGHADPFAARGASARTDRADVALALHKVGEGRRSLEVVKSRRRNLGERIHFAFDGELGYRLVDPTHGPAPRDWGAEAERVVREEQAAGRAAAARKTIQERLGIADGSAEDRALTRALQKAVEEGLLAKADRGHYALPAPCRLVGGADRHLDHEEDERAQREMRS